jgi:hypothetical protein
VAFGGVSGRMQIRLPKNLNGRTSRSSPFGKISAKDEIGELESLFCGIYQKDDAPARLTNKEGIRKSRLSEKRGKSGRYLKKFD